MGDLQCFEVFTLFPDAVESFARTGLLGKALDRGLVEVRATNFRDFTTDKHRSVDDTPFGGGAGMVIKPEPVVRAIEHVQRERGPMHRVLLTPSAPRFDQRAAEALAEHDRIALLCGRYEGIDDRVREHFVDACYSLGDFILNGGEVAALAIIEAVSRLREGVLGNPESTQTESFAAGPGGAYLEHPQYTRPKVFRGHEVPPVLLGGNHQAIAAWRRDQARARTFALRRDLREVEPLSAELHVAVPASVEPSAEWVEVLRRHDVMALVVLGTDPAAVMPWVQATGGRIKVVGFPSLAQLRRRLRQRHGRKPASIALARPADLAGDRPAGPQALTDPALLLDALRGPDGEGPRSAIIIAGLDPWGVDAEAVYAPAGSWTDGHAPSAGKGAQTQDQTLATGPGIEDSSRPPALMVVDLGLAGLLTRLENDG
ncbi:MAG: tRNA (guanosine(37)-N1)-methyltransferase TrmD [Nannocystaceae bacterium]|nr:tRNA (guanosine(37)-N1)-methyltransferase TrmD [bacterium]